jgi:hypothetical protein
LLCGCQNFELFYSNVSVYLSAEYKNVSVYLSAEYKNVSVYLSAEYKNNSTRTCFSLLDIFFLEKRRGRALYLGFWVILEMGIVHWLSIR